VDDPAGERALSEVTDGTGLLIPDGLDATLVLLRHGESTLLAEGRFQGQAETPLTAIGRRQADLAGLRLATPQAAPSLPVPVGPPVEIVHSPLGRASQTAEAVEGAMLAAGKAVPRRADRGFLEIGQGEWQGLHRTEISARYAEVLAGWRRSPLEYWAPGGESLPDIVTRVRPALGAVLGGLAAGGRFGTHDRSQVAGHGEPPPDHRWSIVVAHDGVFKIALLTLFDLPIERFWMWTMDLCGITVVELRAGRPVLRLYNSTAHLAALASEAEDRTGEAAAEAAASAEFAANAEAEAEARRRSGAL
jgi:probable phosphoglycerate mutase